MVAARTRRRLARRIAFAVLRSTRPITHRWPTRTSRGTADQNAVPARCSARTLRSFRVTVEKIWLLPHTQKPLRHPDGWLAGWLSSHSRDTKHVAENIDPHDARHRSRRCRYPSDGASVNFAVVPAGLQIRYRALLSLHSVRRQWLLLLHAEWSNPSFNRRERNNERFVNLFTRNPYVDELTNNWRFVKIICRLNMNIESTQKNFKFCT